MGPYAGLCVTLNKSCGLLVTSSYTGACVAVG